LKHILEQAFGTISDQIRGNAASRPDHPALIQDEKTLSYRELNSLMDRIAASLQRDGLQPRDAIAICAATSLDYAAVFLGALRAGIVVAPLSTAWTADSLAGMMKDAEVRKIFVDAAGADALASQRKSIGAPLVALNDAAVDDASALADWLDADGAGFVQPNVQPDWPYNIIYSSGTTGTPKGIVQSHYMRWGNVKRGVMNHLGPDSVLLVSIPLYSNLTLVNLFGSVALGGTAILMDKFDAATYLQLAEKYRVTHTVLVPVQYQRVLADPRFDSTDLSSFRVKTCAGAPFAAALKAEVVKRWPGQLTEYYGMTEGGAACYLQADKHPDKLHTIGKPTPESEIRLLDDQDREVAPGQLGEIVGHSTLMMSGYFKLPEKTREVEWFDATGKRFIRTGDIGRFDEDGFLTLFDRKKDMIISGGFNIYPSDIESILRAHPAVADASVVGVPSEKWGETPVGFVVQKTGASVDANAIMAWANDRLAKSQRLSAVVLTDDLPRNQVGKVLKRELRDRYKA
jgi:acyl-CoA synthetase (AMP-forming)/AMP-acid ligase II